MYDPHSHSINSVPILFLYSSCFFNFIQEERILRWRYEVPLVSVQTILYIH